MCTVLSLIILLIVHYYTYTYVNIYTHIPRAHTYVISICREYITHDLGNVDVKKKKKKSPRASSTIVRAPVRVYLWVCPNSFVRYIHHRVVCTRAFYVCALMRPGFKHRPRARHDEKWWNATACADSRLERCSRSRRSRMRFFARARSRGLSRSQPVFVIIMLEKCMNICFINASSYFISFYDKKKSETELPETR